MRKIASLSLSIIFAVVGLLFQDLVANTNTADIKVPAGIALQTRNSITGFIFTESRVPLSDVYVELLDDFYVTIIRTRTNGSGIYSFRNLPNGRYNIKVLAYTGDYEEQTRSVSLVGVSPIPGNGSVNEQIDFYLKVKKNLNEGPLAAPGVIFIQAVPDNAKKLYEGGVENLRNKQENEGFDNLKKALELFPDYYLALDRLGTEYVIRGYYTPAFVLLTKSLEVNPRSFSSSFGLGLALYRLGQFDKATENLKRATEIYNKSAKAYLWLGISLHQNKKLSDAETAMVQANKLSKGESAEVHWQLARIYKDQKRFRESADELELFLKYNSEAKDTEKIKQMVITLRQKETKK